MNTPQDLAVFPPQLADTTPFMAYAEMVVASEIDAGYVSDRRQEIKGRIKEIEAARKSFTEPLLESKRRIDDQAKRLCTPLEAIIRVLDQKLIAWHQSQEQIRIDAEQEKRAQELARLEAERLTQLKTAMITGDEKAAEAVAEISKHQERIEAKPLEIANITKTPASTTYMQMRWTFELVDTSQIPREFLMVDSVKLQRFATAMKHGANVPGVRFFQKPTIGGK